jgi:hypothetical protein
MGLENKEEQEKRSVIIAVVAISLIIFAFLWRFAFSPIDYGYSIPIAKIQVAPNIDFDYLKGKEFNYFKEYKQIEPLDEEFMGRDNPFLPY